MSEQKSKANKERDALKAGRSKRDNALPIVEAVGAKVPLGHAEGKAMTDFTRYYDYRTKAKRTAEGVGYPSIEGLGESIHPIQYVAGEAHIGVPLSHLITIQRMLAGVARDSALKNLVDPISADHEMLVAVHPHALNMMKDLVASVGDEELAADVRKFLKDRYIRKPPFKRIRGGPPPGGRPRG